MGIGEDQTISFGNGEAEWGLKRYSRTGATQIAMIKANLLEDGLMLTHEVAIKARFQSSIISWYLSNGRAYPWRQTTDAYKILIAEVLLRLTGAWKAQSVYERIIGKYGTPELLASASVHEITDILRPLGLWNRSNTLINIGKQLSSTFGGSVPRTYSELVGIKGIGQYTANAILCLAYKERVPMVDMSVSRIFQRCLGFTTSKPAYADKELWSLALGWLPEANYREYSLGLLDLGALVCKYVRQSCVECPVASCCQSRYRVTTHAKE